MSHQDRRAPLPADYQYPTHGVDCDCPPCRNSVASGWTSTPWEVGDTFIIEDTDLYRRLHPEFTVTQTAYGWGV